MTIQPPEKPIPDPVGLASLVNPPLVPQVQRLRLFA